VDAREVRAAFGNLLVAPVRAIIYTHGHPDHTGGAAVFAGNDNPDIYSHQLLVEGPPDLVRGMRDGGDQFGMALPDSLFINAGIQMQFGRVTPPTREGYVPPTRTFSGDQLSLTIAGVRRLLYPPAAGRQGQKRVHRQDCCGAGTPGGRVSGGFASQKGGPQTPEMAPVGEGRDIRREA
jgi:hypothetical protein